ncbi:MAG: helix-turn-helix domain-containing protein [Pseudonocardiales bacterium]|nr:helix-turn-helix domain-containing protein [Pseudonocardiales bacterium]
MPTNGTTLVRRQLGRRLKQLREAAGKTVTDVEAGRYMSAAKLWRIETGKTSVKINDARGLCFFYGADAETTDAIVALALGSSEQGWWEDYSDILPSPFHLMISLEASTTGVRSYEPELVYALLQTPDYARAVLRALRPDEDTETTERRVGLRLERQQAVFGRSPAVQIRAVLNEAALTRQVGGTQCLAAQIDHLRELDQTSHVDLYVLTWAGGAHAGMDGAFSLLDFDEPDDPTVVFLENRVGASYLEQAPQVQAYRETWLLLLEQAIPLKEYQP